MKSRLHSAEWNKTSYMLLANANALGESVRDSIGATREGAARCADLSPGIDFRRRAMACALRVMLDFGSCFSGNGRRRDK